MKEGDLVWVRDKVDGEEVLRVYAYTDDSPQPFCCRGYAYRNPETPENVRKYSNDSLIGWKYCRPYAEALVRGDLVWVGDTMEELTSKKFKKIFLADVGGHFPITVVRSDHIAEEQLVDKFTSGDYNNQSWKYCEKVIEEPVKEYTVAEIEKLLGHKVKIVGEKV